MKLTQDTLLTRIKIYNAYQVERQSELTKGRIADMKLGRVKLTKEELKRIHNIIKI